MFVCSTNTINIHKRRNSYHIDVNFYLPFRYAFVNSRRCCIPDEPQSGLSKLLHVPSAVRYISVSSHVISASQFGSMSARLKCSIASSSRSMTSLLLSPSALRRNKSKKDGKDQESLQLSTTPDPGYHMGK